ncbi:MAG: leucyl aminopeptidase [Bacteriovoracaceae bacterium]|nr:leucyl aminopeptidase [Bacteriovoracaceae bacterium]
MLIKLDTVGDQFLAADLKILTAFQKTNTEKPSTKKKKTESSTEASASIDHWSDKGLKEEYENLKAAKNFKAAKDETLSFTGATGETVWVVGLGDKTKVTAEDIRKAIAKAFKAAKAGKFATVAFDVTGFNVLKDEALTSGLIAEAVYLSDYSYDKYKSKKTENVSMTVVLGHIEKKNSAKIEKTLASTKNICDSISVIKDFVNEAPNHLHSEEYARRVEADVKKNLKGVKIKILNKAAIQKEKMGMLLAVNAGSAYEPRIVHLTYEPAKATSKTKHIALVGKGITFDTGGYSLKPGASMMNMKNDMGGSATVYGAFRAAVLEKAPVKITCIMAMTDNAVNEYATMPDSIVTARNGKTVEILNTDAEGRLILGDALDYACDQNPDYIIDAATLTGACLVALGNQVCAILGNDQKWIGEILDAAKNQDEYMWQLPIINEWRQDIKSKIADLKNIGTPMRAGTALGAAFLEEFIKNDIKWAHLDVAGVVDSQSHLPYCSSHGASGLIVRSLTHLLVNGK